MNIISLSINRPTLLFVVYTILALGGLLGFQLLSYELLPKFSPPVVTVQAVFPGASPSEVEKSVTIPLEDLVSSVESIDKIESTSKEYVSIVVLHFKDGVDVDELLDIVQRKINAGMSTLPEEVDNVSVNKFDFDDMPVVKLAVNADLPSTELFDLLDNKVTPELARIEGVAQVAMIGGQEREVKVMIDPVKLNQYKIGINEISNVLQRSNLTVAAGKLKSNAREVSVRIPGKITTIDELKKLVIKNRGTAFVRLGDIAEVIDTQKDIEVLARLNGKTAVGIEIRKQSDANAVDLSASVQQKLLQLSSLHKSKGLHFDVIADTSVFTLDAAKGVFKDLVNAILLVALVMFIFLQNVRNSLIILFVVPVSLVITLGAMYALGYTFNLMSLLGLTLAVGTLVDDAICVIENIYRHMEMGKGRWQAALDGTKEIGLTILATTLTLIVVFFPITLTEGLVANILTQFCMVIVVSVALSTLVAYTIVPSMSARFAKIESFDKYPRVKRLADAFENGINAMSDKLKQLLNWTFRNKTVTLSLTVAVFLGSFYLIPAGYIQTEFFAAGDRGEFLIELESPKGTPLKQSNLLALRAQEIISQYPEVADIYTTVGITMKNTGGQSKGNLAELYVLMVPKDQRELTSAKLAHTIKNRLTAELVGVKVKQTNVNILGRAENAPIDIRLLGTETDSLMKYAAELQKAVASVPGVVEAEVSLESGNPEVFVDLNRDLLSVYGLNVAEVAGSIRTAFFGNRDHSIEQDGLDYDIALQLDAFDRDQMDDVAKLAFYNRQGLQYKLSQFADIGETTGPANLTRLDRIASVAVTAKLVGRAAGNVNADIDKLIPALNIPEWVDIRYGGSKEQQSEGFGSLGIALIASILLVYLILVALYDSFTYPLVVLFTIPLALIGALWALALAKDVLSLFSIMGIIMLIGLVAKNAILVVDFAVELLNKGEELQKALVEATCLRLRPILMTNISMIVGLFPIALASGAGAEWKTGLGWGLIGGLTSSMFLSLIIVPLVFYILYRVRAKVKPVTKNNSSLEPSICQAHGEI